MEVATTDRARPWLQDGDALVGLTITDGGFSGSTLERPELRRHIADVSTGQIDIIVVYKVDG